MTVNPLKTRSLLRSLYAAAVRAALPDEILAPHLPPPPCGRLVILAIGKAAGSMAVAAEAYYAARFPDLALEGIALTRYGHARATTCVEIVEAGHPVPDENGMAASARILALAKTLGCDDLALVLLSGGGSALLTLPCDGVTLADTQYVTRALLASGAPISDINCVRKHLSQIKGGRLAEAIFPAPALTLAISDSARDDPSVIASGPTVADPTTRKDALQILRRYRVDVPAHITHAIERAPESPKPGAAALVNARYEIIASGASSLAAAEALARQHGYEVHNLGDRVEGEARDVATRHASLAMEAKHAGRRVAILSGGEASVTLSPQASGRGGPNQEYALALALALNGEPGISAIAGDTDGIDGGAGASDDPAGAFVLPDTLSRARAIGLDPAAFLASHDSSGFFVALGDLLKTGPSFTNVNDFRVILVEGHISRRDS